MSDTVKQDFLGDVFEEFLLNVIIPEHNGMVRQSEIVERVLDYTNIRYPNLYNAVTEDLVIEDLNRLGCDNKIAAMRYNVPVDVNLGIEMTDTIYFLQGTEVLFSVERTGFRFDQYQN